jgi:cytochrome c oxidase subunit 2
MPRNGACYATCSPLRSERRAAIDPFEWHLKTHRILTIEAMGPMLEEPECAETRSGSCLWNATFRAHAFTVLLAAASTGGCDWRHGALDPAAVESNQIGQLFWVFFWLSWVIFAMVVIATALAYVRASRRRDAEMEELSRDPALERRMRGAVTASTITSVAILIGLLIASVASGRKLSDLGRDVPMTVEVTAHQWWWEVRYPGASPDQSFSTANELHVPVGRNVTAVLRSADVIHSFWVPRLTGKRDLIPGQTTAVAFRANTAGTFPGRCAEFCGVQHARMDLSVVAEDDDSFERWRSSQRAPGASVVTEGDRRGQAFFMRSSCATCHRISGTPALATVGPDLTHVAARRVLAAGALPNDARSMAGWVKDPQRFKPGAQMPPTPLSDEDVAALVTYLGSLR